MNDTHAEIARQYHQMLLSRSAEDRLKMGCSMYGMAKRLVRASILATNPDASPTEIRRLLFLRFYGHEFSAEQRERILGSFLAEEE